MPPSSTRLIVMLAAGLLAVLVGSALVLGVTAPSPISPADQPAVPLAPLVRPSPEAGIGLSVLERTGFVSLNKQLIQEGALPVKPLPGGKANPFLQ